MQTHLKLGTSCALLVGWLMTTPQKHVHTASQPCPCDLRIISDCPYKYLVVLLYLRPSTKGPDLTACGQEFRLGSVSKVWLRGSSLEHGKPLFVVSQPVSIYSANITPGNLYKQNSTSGGFKDSGAGFKEEERDFPEQE